MPWRIGVYEPVDRLDARHHGAHEDGEHDREPRQAFRPRGAHPEGDPERDGREGVARVVDQVGEQRHGARGSQDRRLNCGGDGEHAERSGDSAHALAGALDRVVDEAVRVAVVAVVRVRRQCPSGSSDISARVCLIQRTSAITAMSAPITTITQDSTTPTTRIVIPNATTTGPYDGSGRWISSVG